MEFDKYKNRILILLAHPALQKSRVNKVLIQHVKDIDGVTLHDLYEMYPDFHIDIVYEQELLTKNDIIIFQYPLFWYNVPALLKEWQELVLAHRWAYGKGGVALRGKKLLCAITTGAREKLYHKEGFNRFTVKEYLNPISQLAYVCGMDFLPPFVVHGTHTITESQIERHGKDYQSMIIRLRDDKLDLERARSLPRLNADTDKIIKE
jgi:glutathione-regulated potassium-efflux system ancillary protein KefG